MTIPSRISRSVTPRTGDAMTAPVVAVGALTGREPAVVAGPLSINDRSSSANCRSAVLQFAADGPPRLRPSAM